MPIGLICAGSAYSSTQLHASRSLSQYLIITLGLCRALCWLSKCTSFREIMRLMTVTSSPGEPLVLDSEPEVLDLLTDQLGWIATSKPGSQHLAYVVVI